MAASDFATGGGGGGGGGGATGHTILVTAALPGIFSLVPIEASTEPQDRPNQRGSFEQGLVVRQFVPQCRTGTDIRRNVARASES